MTVIWVLFYFQENATPLQKKLCHNGTLESNQEKSK